MNRERLRGEIEMVAARLHFLASIADNPAVRPELRRYADEIARMARRLLPRHPGEQTS